MTAFPVRRGPRLPWAGALSFWGSNFSPVASPARVLLLGADAYDPDLARSLAAAGELPVFAELLRTGASVPTEAPIGLFVGATWLTVATGLRADHHGYYTWLAQEPHGYGFHQTSH